MVEEGSVVNERISLGGLTRRYRGALVVLEAGCHSPWISRYLQEQGCRVLVANPRKLRAIYQHERKSDRRDAQMLARIGRLDPALLYPVRHGTAEAQQDLLRIKLRDSLVRARVAVINSVRFTLKSLGYTVRNPSNERPRTEKDARSEGRPPEPVAKLSVSHNASSSSSETGARAVARTVLCIPPLRHGQRLINSIR